MRLMIADDHPFIVSGLKHVLEGTRFEISACLGDGASVLLNLDSVKPDILLIDVQMPKKTGVEVLRQLRQAGSKQKVVILTGTMSLAQASEAIELGADGILLKENGARQLIECLDAVAGGKRWLDPDVTQQVLQSQPTFAAAKDGCQLTEREMEVAQLVAKGLQNKVIGSRLSITEGTVKVYLSRIYAKLGLHSRTELAVQIEQAPSRQKIAPRERQSQL